MRLRGYFYATSDSRISNVTVSFQLLPIKTLVELQMLYNLIADAKDLPKLGFLDPSTSSKNGTLVQGTKMELPLWMAKTLKAKNR